MYRSAPAIIVTPSRIGNEPESNDSVAQPALFDKSSSKTSQPRLPLPAITALAGTLLLAVVLGIGRFAYTPLLPAMQEALGWSVRQAGDVASANFLGYMLGAILASILAQRRQRRLWLLVGMALAVASISAGLVVTSFAAWLAIRFVAGVASALGLILGTAVIMEYLVAQNRPQLGALHFAGVGTGIVVSVLAIEMARRAQFTIFGQWGLLGLISLLLLGATWRLLTQIPAQPALPKAAGHPDTSHQPLFSKRFTRLSIAYGFFGFGYVVTATFIVAMARGLERAAWLEPLTWLIVGLFAAPSILVWQRIAQRTTIFAALRFAYAVQALGVLLAGFGSNQVALLIGGACLGGTFMGMTALGLAAARQTAGDDSGRAMGWVTAFFGLGQLLGPALAGRLAQLTHSFAAPSLLAAALLFTGIVLLWNIENA